MGWDPVGELTDEDRTLFGGRWERRLWLNVPGPFYTGETDTCWTGRLHAPDNVLYAAACESVEYVFRQPRDPREVRNVVAAADEEPFGEYACDGDLRWTPPAVRQWWAERARVAEHLAGALEEFGSGRDRYEDEAVAGVLDFGDYLAGALAADLRAYLFRLEEGRYPVYKRQGQAGGLEARQEEGEGFVDRGAEVPVAGVVDAVDAAFAVEGEVGARVGLDAEGAELGGEGSAQVGEGAGEVESGERVEPDGGGGDLTAGSGGGDGEAAEFGPGLDGGGEDGVPVSGGGGVVPQGVGPVLGLLDVPAAGFPAGGAQGGVHGDREARGRGAVVGG